MTRPTAPRSPRRGVTRSFGGSPGRPAPPPPVDPLDLSPGHPPWWWHVFWPVVATIATAGGMLLGGVPAWRAAAIALAVGAALWAMILTMTVEAPSWPYDSGPYDAAREEHRSPTVWEVPGLAGARESDMSFQHYLRPRLWALAEELLRRRGIDPASQAAVDLVGRAQYALLSGADTDSGRAMASVSVLCQTIARLAVGPAPGSAPPIRNPALGGLAGRPRRGSPSRKLTKGHHR